jgi:hypothetical protein
MLLASPRLALSLHPVLRVPLVRLASQPLAFPSSFLMRTQYELNRYITECYSTAGSP